MNRICLLRGWESLTSSEFMKFMKGDTILGDGARPEKLKEWPVEEIEEAKAVLDTCRCVYDRRSECVFIEEYALGYFEIDDDGDVYGGDFDFAKEEK